MATEQEIKKSLTRLMDAFTIYNKDPEVVKAFTRIVVEKLGQFPVIILDAAVEKIIDTFTFMPKIAEMLSACYSQRDEMMRPLNNKFQTFKDDFNNVHEIHSLEEWEELRDDFLRLDAKTSAVNVMESYDHYSKKGAPISPEMFAEGKKKMDALFSKLSVKD
jgi:hypothetical protein